MEDIGWKIREQMSRARIVNLKELHKLIGDNVIGFRTLKRRMANPGEFRVYELELIANALDTSITELLGGSK